MITVSGTPDEASIPAPWIVGATLLPFGLVIGFTITALPYLLTKSGISVDRVAGVSATVMSPTFWGFLLNPLLDSGFTRRTYCWITLAAAAICLPLGLWILSLGHLGVATAFMLLAELAMVLFASAITGWTAEFVPEAARGAVGGWLNVANLGGGALGSLVIMSFAARFDARWLGLGMMLAILLGAIPLVFLPPAQSSSFHLHQAFATALKATWEVCKRRENLTGFALFLAPASTAAAINLFSGLGQDFHTAPATVIVVTGAGCALIASLGSLLGGILSSRYPRGYVYLVAGFGAGLCALAMAFLPQQRITFICGVLLYNGLAGITYASFTALGLELVGHRNPVASTQLGLFGAATNGAIVCMTWADGQGYRHFGVRGLLCVDGIAAVAAAIPLLFLVRRQLRAREVEEKVQTA
jgi:Major Facilitator Superfamily